MHRGGALAAPTAPRPPSARDLPWDRTPALGESVRYVCNRHYGYYALRSEPGFYRRPYYGYYRGY